MTADDARYLTKPVGLCRDKRLTCIEADFLCLIAQLQNAGGCKASNRYFADYFGLSRIRAVQTISSLRKKGFIETTEKKSGKETVERIITVLDEGSKKSLLRSKDSLQGVVRKAYRGSKKNYNQTIETTIEYDSGIKKLRNITPEDIQLWKQTYPLLDIDRQLRKMEVWLDANPAKRPRSNYKRFIASWLAREKPEAGGYVPREIDEDEAETILQQIGAE